jgi:hypothetical protein
MALFARKRRMLSGQRVMRIECVIKLPVQPVRRRVAAQLHVRRILAVCEFTRVAGVASGRRSLEDVVEMACRTRQRGVSARQSITGHLEVIKLRIEPRIHRVAAFTRGREPR